MRNLWTPQARAAYVACAIDTDGWISLRYHRHNEGMRITGSVGVTNQSIDFLRRIAEFARVPLNVGRNGRKGHVDSRAIQTVQDVWQVYWRSPLHVVSLLELALPYLIVKRERAEWVLEFARSRIGSDGKVTRRWNPYRDRDFALVELVYEANGKRRAA